MTASISTAFTPKTPSLRTCLCNLARLRFLYNEAGSQTTIFFSKDLEERVEVFKTALADPSFGSKNYAASERLRALVGADDRVVARLSTGPETDTGLVLAQFSSAQACAQNFAGCGKSGNKVN